MDNNYCAPLAAILRKAQGCIYLGTDEFIDVGGEVSELRRICDSQRAELAECKRDAKHRITRLRDALFNLHGNCYVADAPTEMIAAEDALAAEAIDAAHKCEEE